VRTFEKHFVDVFEGCFQDIVTILRDPFVKICDGLDVLFEDEDMIDDESRQRLRVALKPALAKVDMIRIEIYAALLDLHRAQETRRRAKMVRMRRSAHDRAADREQGSD